MLFVEELKRYNKNKCLKYYEIVGQLYIYFKNKNMAIKYFRKAIKFE